VWRGFEPARQTALELKLHHRTMAKPRQLVKEITDRAFQFEFIGTGELRPAALTAQAGDTHNSQIPIDYRLSRSDGHVLNTPELVLAHDLQ
jgi:hypothetical protein